MGEPRIPVVVAVGFWAASALAVFTYTYIAFKETANGLESGAMKAVEIGETAANPLVATGAILAAEAVAPEKPIDREKFTPSGN